MTLSDINKIKSPEPVCDAMLITDFHWHSWWQQFAAMKPQRQLVNRKNGQYRFDQGLALIYAVSAVRLAVFPRQALPLGPCGPRYVGLPGYGYVQARCFFRNGSSGVGWLASNKTGIHVFEARLHLRQAGAVWNLNLFNKYLIWFQAISEKVDVSSHSICETCAAARTLRRRNAI